MSRASSEGTTSSLARHYQMLLQVSQVIASHRELSDLLQDLGERLRAVVCFDELFIDLHDPATNTMRLHVLKTAGAASATPGTGYPVNELPTGLVWQTQEPLIVADLRDERRWPRFVQDVLLKVGIHSTCVVPLTTVRQRLGTLGFGSKQPHGYDETDLEFLRMVASQVAVTVENALAFEHIGRLKEKLQQEKSYLEEEIDKHHNFTEFVGSSTSLRTVLRDVDTVAPTDSTVLILGETGTGKELVARAVHHRSKRRERTFVKVNCAAIPTGLLESELFGHEKGAFTGAVMQRIGRFQLADQGTLFLDEVGEIPLELQPKLLRVLQDQEFERLGSAKTMRVNVRLMAATNRDLAQLVATGRFRADLYYRLRVFPITLPPLRARREDVPELVRYFVQRCARRMGKQIDIIPDGALAALTAYSWPGNVRELENLIERAVILTTGSELQVPLGELVTPTAEQAEASATTLIEAEREHIFHVLEQANWVLSGPTGAAARLGMKRSTLQSMMKRLGITRPT